MKKIVISLLILSLALSVLQASAQEDSRPFRFGLHASPSVSWLNPETSDYDYDGLRIGFGYGLLAEYSFSDNYSISTGFDVVYQGGRLSYADTIEFDAGWERIKNTTYKLQYLHLPIMLKMSTNEIGYITYFANVGLGAGIRLSGEADYILDDGDNTRKPEVDITDNIALFKTSLIFGMGIEYSLAENIALVGALNFNNGFNNILREDNAISEEREKAIANYLELKVGLLF